MKGNAVLKVGASWPWDYNKDWAFFKGSLLLPRNLNTDELRRIQIHAVKCACFLKNKKDYILHESVYELIFCKLCLQNCNYHLAWTRFNKLRTWWCSELRSDGSAHIHPISPLNSDMSLNMKHNSPDYPAFQQTYYILLNHFNITVTCCPSKP